MIRVASILVLVLVVLFFLSSNHIDIAESRVVCREEEKHALLDFKLSFSADPLQSGVLSSWSIHNPECCEWEGVGCDGRNGHLVSLDMSYLGLESNQLRPSLLVLQHLAFLGLSGNTFTMRIPEFIGSLSKLTSLNLEDSGFYGKIPPHLSNLTRLQTLRLGKSSGLLYADNLQWLSHLYFLEELALRNVELSNAKDWLSSIKMLPSLSEFDCTSCSLPLVPPLVSSSCLLNHSTSLHTLDLSNNNISLSTFSCLIAGTNTLEHVYLDHTNLEPYLEEFLQRMIHSARYTLASLSISGNNLTRLPPELMMFPLLDTLDISNNLIDQLPNLTHLPSLIGLEASFNRLSGNIYTFLHHLPTNLTALDLSANSFNGVVLDAHLSKFSYLGVLDLAENHHLTFNFTKSWVPPFQLLSLNLRSCKIGPRFPNWVLTQTSLFYLDLSNTSISDIMPTSFWSQCTTFIILNISNNNVHGIIPNLSPSPQTRIIDLSFNEFHGPIPLFLFSATVLDLSNNQFSCFSPFHHKFPSEIGLINLSNNILSGSLPNWIFLFDGLLILNLASNMLSGTIPSSVGFLWQLNALHLNNNRLSGKLPSSMKNCTQLTILELGNNNLSGSVPFWLGESLPQLIILNLRSNNFSGDLPYSICHLQRLQVLDLSSNKISGFIPDCVGNFTSMAKVEGFNVSSADDYHMYTVRINGYAELIDYALITWKGILTTESGGILQQLNVIDLSNNRLTGKIPSGFASLKYLRSLDLSRNNLEGGIPDEIGQLTYLEVLKVSSNALSGEIPRSLAGLTFLNTLNVSSNNLEGSIPTSTQLQSFDPSSYAGNPKLCGEPLPTKCPWDISGVVNSTPFTEEANEAFDLQAFFAALGSGLLSVSWESSGY